MGKIKTDDKSGISGNSCKTETKCKGDSSSSSISSLTKKRRSDDGNSSMNELNDKSVDPQYKVRGAGMSRTRECRTTGNRSILRKMTKNKVAEDGKGIFTTNVKVEKETTLTSRHISSKSKSEVASSKRLMIGESSQRCSDDEQPTSKRVKPIRIPAVHIQRLRSSEPVLFSPSDGDKHHNAEGKPTKTVLTNTTATDLSESQGKSCQLLDSSHSKTAVKYESNFHSAFAVDNQKPETFKVKQEKDCDDGHSAQVADDSCAQCKNEVASSVVVPKSGEELKSPKLSKCCDAADEGLIANRHSNLIAGKSVAGVESSCNDVVLKVDRSCSKTTRKPRSDDSRKRSGTEDDSGCSATMPIKREPSVEYNAATAEVIAQESSKADKRAFIPGTPNKTARKSSNNLGAKTAKKARPAKHKQPTHPSSNVSLSILTRSMIKIPG